MAVMVMIVMTVKNIGDCRFQYLQVFDGELCHIGSLDLHALQGASVRIPKSSWLLRIL